MGCSPGSQISWSDFVELANAVDGAGSTAEGYTPLVQEGTIWVLPGKITMSSWYVFELPLVEDPTATIQRQYIQDPYGAGRMELALEALIEIGDLHFVHEADGCWCTSIFQVARDGGDFTLVEIGGTLGCCQSIPVPVNGEELSYNQYWIPAAYVSYYRRKTVVSQKYPQLIYGPKCEEGPESGIFYERQEFEPRKYTLFNAGREIAGYYTWPIRSAYLAAIRSKIEEILGILKSDGASFYYYTSDMEATAELIPKYCAVTWPDLIYSVNLAYGGGTDPGCLQAVGSDPWTVVTCGGELCDGYVKVYCYTLIHLSQAIGLLGALIPDDEEIEPICECAPETIHSQAICTGGESCDTEECDGLPDHFDLTPFQGAGFLGPGPANRSWRVVETGAGVVYHSGQVDEDGTLIGLPASAAGATNYCYPGFMALQICCEEDDGEGGTETICP